MAMRAASIISASVVFVILLVMSVTTIPDRASAAQQSGTSPSFAPGVEWSVGGFSCGVGDIIEWAWSTSDTLSFSLLCTSGTTTTHIYGFSSVDGYVVTSAGFYGLAWLNNNWFFSATVSYAYIAFTPSLTITTPGDGSYSKSFGVSVQGKYDGYADGVLVGPDALHLYDAATVGTDWGFDSLGLDEGLNTVLVRSYYLLDYYGTKNCTLDRTVRVTVDITIPELNIIEPRINDYVAGTVDMSWQCSDNTGIAKREVKVDASDWVTVMTDAFTTQLDDGSHSIKVQVTDLAGNSIFTEVHLVSDTVRPQVAIAEPDMNAKISKDNVALSWSGSDDLSGIDHYEVRITGGDWVNVGNATSYQLTNLRDVWYSVDVKAVDKSGNTATSTVGFGIYTSIWSQNGPYQGIPLFALIAAIIIGAVVIALLFRRKKEGPAVATVPKEDASPQTQ